MKIYIVKGTETLVTIRDANEMDIANWSQVVKVQHIVNNGDHVVIRVK